jgi:23S rRNA (cytidine1920-2'-O)/16S rRNA (cytidine1409-2'-O)-methyltransferase
LKIRLDQLLVQRKIAENLAVAQSLIGAGKVYVDERIVDKAGSLIQETAHIRVLPRRQFVSRGGLKLQEGLLRFAINTEGMVCIDIGASSGGFTDCLLQHGAKKVYAVDVAYGQLDWKLRQDSRVVVMERFNARNLTPEHIPESIDLAVMDASFISLTKLIPPLLPLFKKDVALIALIKPQFELAKEKIGLGGVVREAQLHEEALASIRTFAQAHALIVKGIVASPIHGRKGNKEYLIYLVRPRSDE